VSVQQLPEDWLEVIRHNELLIRLSDHLEHSFELVASFELFFPEGEELLVGNFACLFGVNPLKQQCLEVLGELTNFNHYLLELLQVQYSVILWKAFCDSFLNLFELVTFQWLSVRKVERRNIDLRLNLLFLFFGLFLFVAAKLFLLLLLSIERVALDYIGHSPNVGLREFIETEAFALRTPELPIGLRRLGQVVSKHHLGPSF